jgi:hypothetical protein
MKLKRRDIVELVVMAVATLAGLFVWNRLASAERMRLVPPPGATTLKAFAEQMPPPKRLTKIDDNGSTKIVWMGDSASLSLVSGPACYIFDEHGKLIQWNLSTGDGEPTSRLLSKTFQQPEMSLEEGLKFVNGRAGK